MLSDKDSILLQEEVLLLKKRLKQQDEIILQKNADIAKKQISIAEKDFIIERLKRLVFGQKRERYESIDSNQLNLFYDISGQSLAELQETSEEKKKKIRIKERTAHPGRSKLPEDLEVVETILEPEGDLSEMTYIGDEITEELGYIPEKFFINRIIRKKYVSKQKSLETNFSIAQLPKKIIDKAIASDALLVALLVYKYVDHLPLYRIRQRFSRYNIKIPDSTITGWVSTCLSKLEILYDYSREQIVAQHYIQVDETTIKVLDRDVKKKTHLGYYWVYRSHVDGQLLFEYHPSREGKHVSETLKDFKGYLQTDGYVGYADVASRPDITHVVCMAHIRRKFDEAFSNDKARATYALDTIQLLYAIERKAKEDNITPEQVKRLRLDMSLPIMNKLGKWIGEEIIKVLPKSAIGKAFTYALNRWDEMNNYLCDGNIQIDNNLIENAIRPIALGRKNYLFAGSHEAAQRGAIIYTFMAQCKQAGVDPTKWLEHTLQNIMDSSIQNLDSLLPKNFHKIS